MNSPQNNTKMPEDESQGFTMLILTGLCPLNTLIAILKSFLRYDMSIHQTLLPLVSSSSQRYSCRTSLRYAFHVIYHQKHFITPCAVKCLRVINTLRLLRPLI